MRENRLFPSLLDLGILFSLISVFPSLLDLGILFSLISVFPSLLDLGRREEENSLIDHCVEEGAGVKERAGVVAWTISR